MSLPSDINVAIIGAGAAGLGAAHALKASGLSTTRLKKAKAEGIEPRVISCGRRKFVFGADGIVRSGVVQVAC